MVFVDWWIGLERAQQIFWSLAIVSGILLAILLFISIFEFTKENESSSADKSRRIQFMEPKTVLFALTLFSWVAVYTSYQTTSLQMILLVGALAGLVGAMLPWLFAPLLIRPRFDVEDVLSTTGQVLRPVPPHRNGFGKVHINLRAAPFEMDAVTAGAELPAGVPVRVVDVIDNHVLLVEPLLPNERGMDSSTDMPHPKPAGPGEPGR